ncbi:hypothetical protein GQ457_03G008220 [Hibiscus cannabinus]
MGKTVLGDGAKARNQTALDFVGLHGDVQASDGRVLSLESTIECHFIKLSLDLDAHLETKISAMEDRLQFTLQENLEKREFYRKVPSDQWNHCLLLCSSIQWLLSICYPRFMRHHLFHPQWQRFLLLEESSHSLHRD